MEIFDSTNEIQENLLKWFHLNGRHWIPWKLKVDGMPPKSGEILSVYGIWVAEVMLQQTQLKVVLPYWKKWMQVFPTLIALAETNEQNVLLEWQGLGYYSRAKRLHQSSKLLIELIGKDKALDSSCWPTDLYQWIKLPGIGKSTAGSIISSAFDLPIPILDGNVKRILSRLIASKRQLQKDENLFWEISQTLIHPIFPREFNQALMDLGSIICTPNKPSCFCCPLNQYCLAYSRYDPIDFPVKKMKVDLPYIVIGLGIVFDTKGKILIAQRLENSSMGGMWEFPGGKQEKDETIETTIRREIREELEIDVKVRDKLVSIDHSYSHKKLHFIVHICELISGTPSPLVSQQCRWVDPSELSLYPFPAANIQIINELIRYLDLS